jgi:serine/threonine-protein kinase
MIRVRGFAYMPPRIIAVHEPQVRPASVRPVWRIVQLWGFLPGLAACNAHAPHGARLPESASATLLWLAIMVIAVLAGLWWFKRHNRRPESPVLSAMPVSLMGSDPDQGTSGMPVRPSNGSTITPDTDTHIHPPGMIGRHRIEPARVAHFQLEQEIGRGGMGRVFRGVDLTSGQSVAIKTLALTREFSGLALQEARERFRREAQAAWRLSHQDIVQVLDAGEELGLAYIAMELVGGHDLTRHTRQGHLLGVPDVLEIGQRVARALAHAHSQGVVHRDIKPANVMVDFSHCTLKVTDFGIARISDAERTRTGLVLGSPLYMSPEQLTGKQVDGRSDIYSLGLLIFQLLCGRLPIEAGNMADLMRAVVEQPAPSLLELRPDLPADLADVIALALQKRPELRYADAADLAADLQLVATRHGLASMGGELRGVHEVAEYAQGRRSEGNEPDRFVHNRIA